MLPKLSECAYSALMLGGATDNCLHKASPVFLTLHTRSPFSFPKEYIDYVMWPCSKIWRSKHYVQFLCFWVESFAVYPQYHNENTYALLRGLLKSTRSHSYASA
jgi:hypothetical protein